MEDSGANGTNGTRLAAARKSAAEEMQARLLRIRAKEAANRAQPPPAVRFVRQRLRTKSPAAKLFCKVSA